MKADKLKNKGEKENNVSEFKPIIIPGGKPGNPTNNDYNWLKSLVPGSVFLYRSRQKANPSDVSVHRSCIVHHYDGATQLFDDLNQPVYYIVETAGFSTVMRCVQVLYNPIEENQNEEQVRQGQVGDVQEPAQ